MLIGLQLTPTISFIIMGVKVSCKLWDSSKKSPCYDRLNRHITNEFTKLQEQHIEKWSFFKDSGIDDIYPSGKPFKTRAPTFEGTPSAKFWEPKYIPEYMEKIFDSCLDIVNKSSKEYIIHPNKCYQELEALFLPRIAEIYQKMAEIDSRLRGDGVNIPQPIDTSGYTIQYQNEVKKRLDHYRLGVFRSIFWWLLWPFWLIRNFKKLL